MRQTLLLISALISVMLGSGAALGQNPRGTYVRVDSSRLYFEECGRGDALVLLHDGLMHSSTWDAVWPELCQKFHVVR